MSLHDKTEIERFLRGNPDLHVYALGDLDDFFWPQTVWYGARSSEGLVAVALLYVAPAVPTLLAVAEQPEATRELLESLRGVLPARFYAHLSPGLEAAFEGTHDVEHRGAHCKMALRDPSRLACADCSGVVRLGMADLDEVLAFYRVSYPDTWFDPRMLQTRQCFGLRQGKDLVSVAGVHVYSPQYGVAALGNVATHPAFRNRGFGRRVTARLCRSLLEEVDHVGLNVRSDNAAALRCYESLGFEAIAPYGEFMVEIRTVGQEAEAETSHRPTAP